ncbi:MAG: hypothetical protein SH856_04890 [Flavobacteriales bacterium]|nr:hypothetical protein [Flavobacteriales bacterium]
MADTQPYIHNELNWHHTINVKILPRDKTQRKIMVRYIYLLHLKTDTKKTPLILFDTTSVFYVTRQHSVETKQGVLSLCTELALCHLLGAYAGAMQGTRAMDFMPPPVGYGQNHELITSSVQKNWKT